MSFWLNMRFTLDSLMSIRSASVLYVTPADLSSARNTFVINSGELIHSSSINSIGWNVPYFGTNRTELLDFIHLYGTQGNISRHFAPSLRSRIAATSTARITNHSSRITSKGLIDMKHCLLPAVLCIAASSSAFAMDGLPLASPRASERSPDVAEKTVGVGIDIGPDYLGGKNTVWRAGLFGEANFKNGIFLSTTDGIGYRTSSGSSGFSFAASVGPSDSRREKDGKGETHNRLKGMGDVSTKARANLFANYDVGPFHASTELHQTLGSRHNTEVDVQAKYDVLASNDNLVQVGAGLGYANQELMQTYFGVTATQSANSGNPVYTAKSGMAGASAGFLWRHAFTREWVGTLGTGVTSLRGSAADSPLTSRRTSGTLGMSIGYRF